MKVLMFGWEFPPVISGGLGRACYGITCALAGLGHEIIFVMPRRGEVPNLPGVTIVSAAEVLNASSRKGYGWFRSSASLLPAGTLAVLGPYRRPRHAGAEHRALPPWPAESCLAADDGYGIDLFAEIVRYGDAAAIIAARESFDIIHGHDWMAVPACLEARRVSRRPFILHIHSLEYDRGGDEANREILAQERRGMEEADGIIAVSHYTRDLIVSRYGIPREKVFVVHNAVTAAEGRGRYGVPAAGDERWVLFLGRITYQKGPDYFIEAAARGLKELPEVSFLMAGSGDMMPRMIEKVAELKIGRRFHFTGFLQGRRWEEAFARAALYVMPSVSEPFGLTPLEALMYDVPVIVSRQSGISEVLHHALKVDFWDVDALADKMIAVLKYPPLTGEMVARAREELKNLCWERAAQKIQAVYQVTLP